MNERLETDLLAIIKEGKNLSEGYVEIKPGIRIKAGREREFERLCDNYYELEFNQKIENDTDTITPVYNSLTKLVETENKEYYISKAAEYVLEVKSEVDRYRALTKSFNTVDNAYKLTVKNLNDLYLKRENSAEWQQKSDELNAEVKRLAENSNILIDQMKAARKNVNDVLIKYAEEQMNMLRDSFLKTTNVTDKASTMDHNFVLANDKIEYDSLYRLTLILKHANEIDDVDKFVVMDDAMIISAEQKEALELSVLPHIKLYNYIRKPEVEVKSPQEINNDFINRIKKSMDMLDEAGKKSEKAAWEAIEEKNILIEVLKLVNKANASNFALVEVFDEMAYVLGEDKPKMLKLLNESKILKKFNPDVEKREQNEKLILDLYAYLDSMANNVTSYKGVANLPIKSTKTVGDRAWIIVESDFEEANRIVDIILLLQNQTDNLVPVWGMANINSNDISKFKRLANATKFFGDKVPNIPQNEAEMKKVFDQLKELVKKAKETENAKLASNGNVLEADEEVYKLLDEKYQYLESAKASEDLVPVDGVLIDDKYASRYHEVNEKIDKLLNPSNNLDFSENDKQIGKLKARLAELSAKSSHNYQERNEFDLLTKQIELLENAKSSSEFVEVNGLKFANDEDAKIYSECEEKLKNLNKTDETLNNFENNDKEIEKIKAEMLELEEKAKKSKKGKMADNGKVLKRDAKRYEALENKLKYLEEAKNSNNLVTIDGVKVDKSHAEDYKAADKKSNKGIRKKIKAIRNALPKAGEFLKKNWKLIVAAGFAITVITCVFPSMAPTLIFSNSCLATAMPVLSGPLNLFSNTLSTVFLGETFVPGVGAINMGVEAAKTIPALVNTVLKAATLGVGTATIFKGIKIYKDREYANRLPDPARKSIARKIVDALEGLKIDNLESNVNYTQTNLIKAQILRDSFKENLTGEGETEEEIMTRQFGENYLNDVDEEAEKRIGERAENLSPEQSEQENAPKATVVIPGDEEIGKALDETTHKAQEGNTSTNSTPDDLDSLIAKLEQEAKDYQDIIDVSYDSPELVAACQKSIDSINAQIESLKGRTV